MIIINYDCENRDVSVDDMKSISTKVKKKVFYSNDTI